MNRPQVDKPCALCYDARMQKNRSEKAVFSDLLFLVPVSLFYFVFYVSPAAAELCPLCYDRRASFSCLSQSCAKIFKSFQKRCIINFSSNYSLLKNLAQFIVMR